jgi:hypothetical protein
MIFQSSSNEAIILMQDLLNLQIRMNYPGTGLIIFQYNIYFCFYLRIFNGKLQTTKLKRLTKIYGRDLLYGKSIPPKDMIMKDDSSFFHK